MTRSRLVFVVIAALVLGGWLFARSEAGQVLMGRWSLTKSAEIDRGTYFRLKVKLTYKGEPQDFDIVVGCNVHRIAYKDGSGTYEAGLVPTVYGRRMSDGKGLVIRAPDACDGQTTANGRVPENFMPVIIVYDDANTLAFGTAYISDDAYASPLSLLAFGGATVEAATAGEFDAFRKDGPPNLVTREAFNASQSGGYLEKLGLKRVWPPFGDTCYAYRRFRIPDAARAYIRELWPRDRPTYWRPTTPALQKEADGAIHSTRTFSTDEGQGSRSADYTYFADKDGLADYGVPRLPGGGTIGGSPGLPVPPSYYPATSDFSADKWPADKADWTSFAEGRRPSIIDRMEFREGRSKGFAYCLTPVGSFISPDYFKALGLGENLEIRVDDFLVERNSHISWGSPASSAMTIFERDEFFLDSEAISLDSTRGDV